MRDLSRATTSTKRRRSDSVESVELPTVAGVESAELPPVAGVESVELPSVINITEPAGNDIVIKLEI